MAKPSDQHTSDNARGRLEWRLNFISPTSPISVEIPLFECRSMLYPERAIGRSEKWFIPKFDPWLTRRVRAVRHLLLRSAKVLDDVCTEYYLKWIGIHPWIELKWIEMNTPLIGQELNSFTNPFGQLIEEGMFCVPGEFNQSDGILEGITIWKLLFLHYQRAFWLAERGRREREGGREWKSYV